MSATLMPIDGFDVGKHPFVHCLVRGVFNLRPPVKTGANMVGIDSDSNVETVGSS